jgi:hypothetical protein
MYNANQDLQWTKVKPVVRPICSLCDDEEPTIKVHWHYKPVHNTISLCTSCAKQMNECLAQFLMGLG